MKKIQFLLFSSIVLTACGSNYEQVDITTSMFPHYDAVRQVSEGTSLTYSMIVPPGVEVHSYRPTPKQTAQIVDSKMLFYSADTIETWVSNLSVTTTEIINVHDNLFEDEHNHRLYHQHLVALDDHDHEHGVHFWTSPAHFMMEIDMVAEKLSTIDSENTTLFLSNADQYKTAITSTSEMFINDIQSLNQPQVFFVGHNALEDFGEYFGLDIIPLVDDIKPDADITPLELAELVDAIVASDTTYLFVEELVDPTFARTVQDELLSKHSRQVTILELHGYHNVTLTDFEADISYLDLLNRNLNHLREALL